MADHLDMESGERSSEKLVATPVPSDRREHERRSLLDRRFFPGGPTIREDLDRSGRGTLDEAPGLLGNTGVERTPSGASSNVTALDPWSRRV